MLTVIVKNFADKRQILSDNQKIRFALTPNRFLSPNNLTEIRNCKKKWVDRG